MNKLIKKEAETNPALKKPHRFSFEKDVLTPEIRRHREAAKLLWQRDHGKQWSPQHQERLDAVWSPDTEGARPFLHLVTRRCHMSGIDNAAEAMKNYYASKAGQRKAGLWESPSARPTDLGNQSPFTLTAEWGQKAALRPEGNPLSPGTSIYISPVFSRMPPTRIKRTGCRAYASMAPPDGWSKLCRTTLTPESAILRSPKKAATGTSL